MAEFTPAPPVTLADIDQPAVTVAAGSSLPEIRRANLAGSWWTLVLDDDPTGTQTTHGVTVLMTDWSTPQLEWASRHPSGVTFALTNSRSLDPGTAAALTDQLVTDATSVANRTGRRLRVISRSDSTLRGHVAVEITAAVTASARAGQPVDGTLFVPCFLEAGRYTAGDVQWVRGDHGLRAAADTEFATDTAFGYHEHDLKEFLAHRLGRNPDDIGSITLSELRSPDAAGFVGDRLTATSGGAVTVVNAVQPSDLEVLMLGVQHAEASGRRFVIRSGPSFVRACAGLESSPALTSADIYRAAPAARHGLIVVGSHTTLTNQQLQQLHDTHDVITVELDVPTVLTSAGAADAEIGRCRDAVVAALKSGTVVLRTSRTLAAHDTANPLITSRAVAAALVRTVGDIAASTPLRFLVAKGGITSSDMATTALGATRAVVAGQMFPGLVPLWRLTDGRQPDLPYVVFPGNVGADDALAQVLHRLTSEDPL